ncbi:class I SAM-dependent methyltransferase [Aquimarina sp. W85]|uniref:class I SAM-dependent methyltransferase n=1 Tax=Aquimarina rhodophyticola TaxID=3342246 RepID=UPI00366EC716
MTKNKSSNLYLECIDHTVSKESFKLLYNEDYDVLETFPKPTKDKLPDYYKSEDYISHTDGQRNLFEKLYHKVKGYMLQKKVVLINSFAGKKGTLLDIGAGTGDFLLRAKNKGWLIYGVEPNPEARKIARSKNIPLVTELSELPNQKFDVITLWHVLEHVYDLDQTIVQIKQYLKDDGVLIIAVPNYKSYDAQIYNKFWAAYDVPRHLWHFSKQSISKIGATFGFRLIATKPMFFDSFYVSLLSEKYKTGKMNFFQGFTIGLLSNVKGFITKEYSSHIYILKKA